MQWETDASAVAQGGWDSIMLKKEMLCRKCGTWYTAETNTVVSCKATRPRSQCKPVGRGWMCGMDTDTENGENGICCREMWDQCCFQPYLVCCPSRASKDPYVIRMRHAKNPPQPVSLDQVEVQMGTDAPDQNRISREQ